MNDHFSFYKQAQLIRIGREFSCETFVETGTYLGDTVEAMRHHFTKVLSVELSPELFAQNQQRFKHVKNVWLWCGDSGQMLAGMLPHIQGKALFWLDGHYSGGRTARGDTDCPIIKELQAIACHSRKDHCIVIDDARCFGVLADYPTIETVQSLICAINPDYKIIIQDDCILGFFCKGEP